jgi:hypothetical protein
MKFSTLSTILLGVLATYVSALPVEGAEGYEPNPSTNCAIFKRDDELESNSTTGSNSTHEDINIIVSGVSLSPAPPPNPQTKSSSTWY